MTDKEFRRLKRVELVEIIRELQSNEKGLLDRIAELEEMQQNRELKISKAGSLAEAVVGINGMVEAAQATADQYIKEIRAAHSRAEAEAAEIIGAAQKQADEMIHQAQQECQQLLVQAKTEACKSQEQEIEELLSTITKKGRGYEPQAK